MGRNQLLETRRSVTFRYSARSEVSTMPAMPANTLAVMRSNGRPFRTSHPPSLRAVIAMATS
jgi:hypothetical protein